MLMIIVSHNLFSSVGARCCQMWRERRETCQRCSSALDPGEHSNQRSAPPVHTQGKMSSLAENHDLQDICKIFANES